MESYDLKDLKIMVVDDHAPMRRILMTILRELGVNRITQASDGQEALDNLRQDEPDVIVTDAAMEPLDGFELTRTIRKGDTGIDPFIPIIMVSARTEIGSVVEARDAGVTEFLAKPISALSVYKRLSAVIANPRAFVRTEKYFGPDRRRHALPFSAEDRRKKAHDYEAKGEPGAVADADIDAIRDAVPNAASDSPPDSPPGED